jgi:hypothetical protein
MVAVPASGHGDLRGRRVVVGLPGLGWRYELRADEKVIQGSRTYVPVISEHEWYKAEIEQIEVFAPLVPVERVWVEIPEAAPALEVPTRVDTPRLVSLDTPPRRDPVAVGEASRITGQRVVQVVGSVERRDLRAVTEMYASTDGGVCVRITTELEWYRWVWSGQLPKTLETDVHMLWAE